MQLTMDVGDELAHAQHNLTELLAAIALLADDVVEHAVFSEAADEPGDVQNWSFRRVVGPPNDRFVVVSHLAAPCSRVCAAGYAAFAIRSAIMIVVGFKATDRTTGMIDASITRSPSTCLTAPWGSTTAHRAPAPPIGAVAVGCP
jgi:hypothetical protein